MKPARLPYPWDFPGKDTGVDCHFPLHGIFSTQGSNLSLLCCRWILYRWTTKAFQQYLLRLLWELNKLSYVKCLEQHLTQSINFSYYYAAFPGGPSGKEPSFQCRRHKRRGFDPWVGKIPWRRKMATYSSILAWRIPWTEEPGGLQCTASPRVGHSWGDLIRTRACRHQPIVRPWVRDLNSLGFTFVGKKISKGLAGSNFPRRDGKWFPNTNLEESKCKSSLLFNDTFEVSAKQPVSEKKPM